MTAARRGRHRAVPTAVVVAVLGAVVAVALVGAGIATLRRTRRTGSPSCSTTTAVTTYHLDLSQAANATTIAAVGKRDGLPDHAVTVALAAALQESGLRNLPGGDLDSLGLFQQRPSQGWGTRAQILVPRYAADAFYQRLVRVADWQTLAVTDAAQAVQRSAAPDAYAAWEAEARVVAEALTGEVPAGFACRLRPASPTALEASAMANAARLELGLTDLTAIIAPPQGWVAAGWVVGHAQQFGVASVSYDGWRWTASSGAWAAETPPITGIVVNGP